MNGYHTLYYRTEFAVWNSWLFVGFIVLIFGAFWAVKFWRDPIAPFFTCSKPECLVTLVNKKPCLTEPVGLVTPIGELN